MMGLLDCNDCRPHETAESPGESPSNNEQPFVPSKAYATRKTIAQGALDVALLLANAMQLKQTMDIPSSDRGRLYVTQLALISISITLQIVVGMLLLNLAMRNPKDDAGHKRTETLNNVSVSLILLIAVVNIFISAFSISHEDHNRP